MLNKKKGNWGEQTAADFLISRNHKILERQFRTSRGEVDIISTFEDTLVFTEVKNWSGYSEDSLTYSINRRKEERIRSVAAYYIHNNPHYEEYYIRFDLIFLSGRTGKLEHFINTF